MSVTISAFLVDWDELTCQYEMYGDQLNLWEAEDEEAKWLTYYDLEISLSTAVAFNDLYTAIRKNMVENSLDKLDEFLSAFILTDENYSFNLKQDLGENVSEEAIFGSISPLSAKSLSEIYSSCDLSHLSKAFEEYRKSTNQVILFDNFDQFRSFIGQFVCLIESAIAKGKGIALLCN